MWHMAATLCDSSRSKFIMWSKQMPESRGWVRGCAVAGVGVMPVTSHDLNLHYILIRLPSAAVLMVINT